MHSTIEGLNDLRTAGDLRSYTVAARGPLWEAKRWRNETIAPSPARCVAETQIELLFRRGALRTETALALFAAADALGGS